MTILTVSQTAQQIYIDVYIRTIDIFFNTYPVSRLNLAVII